MTPPRTGTFIYHTHLHDDRQLTAGLYGALLVVEPDEIFDPSTDHVVVISRGGDGVTDPVLLNGEQMPQMAWKAGMRHRIRFVNITPGDIFVTSLSTAEAPVSWQPLTKDGAPVPTELRATRPATFTIAVGETYDFEDYVPAGRRGLWIGRPHAGRPMGGAGTCGNQVGAAKKSCVDSRESVKSCPREIAHSILAAGAGR